ncbi:EF-Tu/IF-2/RF-3 family GTPase [Mycolicibacterium rutilum]|uniref:EF-Tu/IF-2/RF-3 family GTPase n=1 Tax=Mycolicibacterium rutilum TaxID=370526 RepID=UPI003898DCBD
MTVDEVFAIRNRGVVATGRVTAGTLHVGDTVHINGGPGVTVAAIEKFRKKLDEAAEGDTVGLLLKGLERTQVNRGDVITSSGEAAPIESVNVVL